ncbi:MAG TPA: TQO small subunit DoxD [Candidatus Bathyarchaeia archaeon]|nr:TQO small subunit DoxD [Candidatus Bathyarchaeia archaeon]
MTGSKFAAFLFAGTKGWGTYAFVALRVVVAAFWLHSDIPRWVALAAGQPEANGLVRNLFGVSMVVPLTYFFTVLETLAAISFILGFVTRLAAVWAVIEFAIIGAPLLLSGNAEAGLVHALLWSASLVLLLNGSLTLSLDGLIAKRVKTNPN